MRSAAFNIALSRHDLAMIDTAVRALAGRYICFCNNIQPFSSFDLEISDPGCLISTWISKHHNNLF
jgi:hypothetical protein